jgi:hypothetical protein
MHCYVFSLTWIMMVMFDFGFCLDVCDVLFGSILKHPKICSIVFTFSSHVHCPYLLDSSY